MFIFTNQQVSARLKSIHRVVAKCTRRRDLSRPTWPTLFDLLGLWSRWHVTCRYFRRLCCNLALILVSVFKTAYSEGLKEVNSTLDGRYPVVFVTSWFLPALTIDFYLHVIVAYIRSGEENLCSYNLYYCIDRDVQVTFGIDSNDILIICMVEIVNNRNKFQHWLKGILKSELKQKK